MFDFYSDSDRKLDLARKLMAEMQAAGLGYEKTYKVFNEGAAFDFSDPAEFAEWKKLDDEAKARKLVAGERLAAQPNRNNWRMNSENEFEDQ